MFHRISRRFKTLLILIIFVIIFYIFFITYSQNGPQSQSYQINVIKQISALYRYKRDSFLKKYQEDTTSSDRPVLQHYGYNSHYRGDATTFNGNFYFNETLWPRSPKMVTKFKNPTLIYEEERPHYYVYSNKCKMPRPDPFSPEVMAVFYKPEFLACSDEDDLISVQFDNNLQQYRLQVNHDTLQKITKLKLNKKFSSYYCYYSEIIRSTYDDPDERSTFGKRIYFNQDILIPKTVHSLYVVCFTSKRSKSIQEDAFALVQMPNITDTTKNTTETKEAMTETRKPSVIMIGLDSMSRMNFLRTMPMTSAYLNKTGWFEMQGYNKIGDNTYPNVLAILTGYTDKNVLSICNTDVLGCFDKVPFVWNDFKKIGYQTALAEDLSYINTFNYLKPGFLRPPVDYYMRPLLVIIEYAMKYVLHFGYKYCVGRRLSISYVLDYCSQLVERFITNETMPAFGYFWSNSITHDHNFAAVTIDDKFLDYLKHYERLKLFEHAIVIFFSDHGHRFGRLRSLSEGTLEENLPMLFIWLPAWFREKYPQYATALRQNRNCLTSPFDLHMTLKHIVELGQVGEKLPMAHSCPSCQTLFRPVPKERSCSEAGIPEDYCSCDSYLLVANDSYIRYVAKKIVYQMNIYVATNGLIDQCETLNFHRIIKAERKWNYKSPQSKTAGSDISTYRLKFETMPKLGQFEATLTINRTNNEIIYLVVPNISRLNSYQNDSQCIKHKIAKKFCFCFNRKIVKNVKKGKERKRVDVNSIHF